MLKSDGYSMEDYKYLHQSLGEAWTKYVYFLLAVAASAIAFIVSITSEASLEVTQLPLGLAVLLWAVSFFFGCRSIWHRNESLGINTAGVMRQMERMTIPGEAERYRKSVEVVDSHAAQFMRWQFGSFVAGAVCFLIWHILEMALRTPPPAA